MSQPSFSPAYGLIAVFTLVLFSGTRTIFAGPPDFEAEIAPILLMRCVECHQASKASGNLQLTTGQALRDGGDSGEVIDAQSPSDSYLLQRVHDGEMPPPLRGQSQQLAAAEIKLLEQWIKAGATWPEGRTLDPLEQTTEVRAGRDWWSLQPLNQEIVPPPIPWPNKSRKGADHPIDAFVLAKLQRHEMSPAPPADKPALLRRLYYDLLGLPPTRAQIEAFVADDSADAWEKIVDQLLAMPQYGERWARFWLDLVRYADTSGYERDQEKLFAWKYRDWVVNALNGDMPYDQFIIHQLAGDEIPHPNEQSVIATGFLRLGTWNDEPNDPQDYQYDRLEDIVHTTATTFLGLTVKCARCHTHKFDPILQEDYYRMASVFWAGPVGPRARDLLGGPSADELGYTDVLGWTDLSPTPAPLHILKNGQRQDPLGEVTAASLSSIPALERSFDPPPAGAKTSHRRRQLADWIASPQNPLAPRVLVNRIWQHHFGQAIVRTPNNFGFLADPPTHPELLDWLAVELIRQGGSMKKIHRMILTSQVWRQASSHPQHDAMAGRDASNRFLWHYPRRRLEAEAMRDSMLLVSGRLDRTVGGESFKPTIDPEALEGLSRKSSAWDASPPERQTRRSLYIYMKRGLLPPLMTAFDLCDATGPCGKRDVTTVPTQALALLNNRFVHDCAEHLAALIVAGQPLASEQIREAWFRVLMRSPSDQELQWGLQHVESQRANFSPPLANGSAAGLPEESLQEPGSREVLALASLCHVLLNSNEFIFID